MVQENSQFDIPGIQLRESKTQPRVSLSREIGEAQITHTIFGKAKVRIIRKNDKFHRALWLTAAVVVTAIAGAVWQGWFAPHNIDPELSADLILPASSEVQASSPASQVANTVVGEIVPPAAVQTLKRDAGAASIPENSNQATTQKNAPQQPLAMKEAGSVVAKPVVIPPKPAAIQPTPVAVQPATVGIQQKAPLAASSSVAKTATMPDKPLPPKLMPSKPSVVPAATPAVAPRAASSPSAALSPSTPLTKDSNSPELPAGDNQLSSPINPQSR